MDVLDSATRPNWPRQAVRTLGRAFVAASLVLGVPALAPMLAAADVIVLDQIGAAGTGDGQFSAPDAVAVAPNGDVYVADRGNQRVQRFSADGTFVTKWGSAGSGNGQFRDPTGVAVSPAGDLVYVTDKINHRVQVFDPDGAFVSTWGGLGLGDGQFSSPEGIAVAPGGDVFVADANNRRIQRFSADGTFVLKWGTSGTGNGQFSYVQGVAATADAVYVGDTYNNRMQKFTHAGAYLAQWSIGNVVDGVGVAWDGVYATDPANNRVLEYGWDGPPVVETITGVTAPSDVAGAPDGSIVVVDRGNDRLVRFGVGGLAGPPTNLVGTAGNTQVSVAFDPPANDGGNPISGYTVTATPGGATATGPGSPITVNGLTNGTPYTFTARATTVMGDGAVSDASAPVTPGPPATIPGVPTNVVGYGGAQSAWVQFDPPGDGGSPITGYTVTVSPGGATVTGVSAPIVVGGLTDGASYTFTVHATNAVGDGPESDASAPVMVGLTGKIVYRNDVNLDAIAATGAGAHRLREGLGGLTTLSSPRWSPDGSRVLFFLSEWRDPPGVLAFEVWVMDADGSDAVRLSDDGMYPSWSPDGSTIVFASGRDGNRELYTMDADGSNQTRLTTTPEFEWEPVYSPDGTKIAYSRNYEIWSMDADGSGATQLSVDEPTWWDDWDVAPEWSPDGSKIAYYGTDDEGYRQVWVMDADGSAKTQLTDTTAWDTDPAWAPDGTKIVFTSNREDNRWEIYVMWADGSHVTRLTDDPQNTTASADWAAGTTPGAPTSVVGTAGDTQVSVAFDPPTDTGGFPISGYTVTASPGGATASGSGSPIVVTGLTNGTAYTFTVHASTALGDGPESAASAAVTPRTVPGAPTSVVGTPGNGEVEVAFGVPADDGGSSITGYTVTASPGGATSSGSGSPITVTGLTNGTGYTFTVHATNAAGDGPESAASAAVTPRTVPGAPTSVVGTPGDLSVSVAFSAPASDGGTAITGYTVTASPGGATATGSGSPIVVSGLQHSKSYTFTVHATNAVGDSDESDPSDAVLAYGSGHYNAVTPARILDTRFADTGAPVLAPQEVRAVQVAGRGGVPASGVEGVVLNVTAVSPSAGGWFTVFPSDQATPPTASNLNFVAGQTIPNLVTVKLGADGRVKIANTYGSSAAGWTHAIFDVVGWYGDAGVTPGSWYWSLAPTRILDTRFAGSGAPVLAPQEVRSIQVTGKGGVPGSGVDAVVMNVTAVSPGAYGWFTLFPSDLATPPTASNLNYSAGQTIPNLVKVKVGTDGKVKIANTYGSSAAGSTHAIFDVVGWYGPGSTGKSYESAAPVRILDTRFGTGRADASRAPVPGGASITVDPHYAPGVPPAGSYSSVVVNITVTAPAAYGWLTAYPSGDPTPPTASNLNFNAGQTIANHAHVKVGADGTFKIANSYGLANAGAAHIVVDIVGWYY